MTFVKRFALAALVAGLSSAISSPSYAFMTESTEVATAEGSVDLTKAVDQLRQELKAGETECDAMLGKIDAAIEQVDAALDKGVADEKMHLGLRDELVEMRLSLPCLANELTQEGVPMDDLGGSVLSEQVIGEEVISDDGLAPFGATGGIAGGGATGGVAGGAAGGGLAGGISPLAIAGIAAAVAIPAATSGDDEPGDAVSPSE
jgi:hypothetical protein